MYLSIYSKKVSTLLRIGSAWIRKIKKLPKPVINTKAEDITQKLSFCPPWVIMSLDQHSQLSRDHECRALASEVQSRSRAFQSVIEESVLMYELRKKVFNLWSFPVYLVIHASAFPLDRSRMNNPTMFATTRHICILPDALILFAPPISLPPHLFYFH